MCLFPRRIVNKRYVPTKKNGWGVNMQQCDDERKLYINVGCGNCLECRKQRANTWRSRIIEEMKSWDFKNAYFVTLTFSNDSIRELCADLNEFQVVEANSIARLAVRRFTERWRKKYKKTVRHWLITELGDLRGRIHLHGVIWTKEDYKEIENIWKYGFVRIGEYVNELTAGYITKYITKIDNLHQGFKAKIFASKGIGVGYVLNPTNKIKHAFKGENTRLDYKDSQGFERSLPLYYKSKLYSDEERQRLFTAYLDRGSVGVMGVNFDISNEKGVNAYYSRLKYERKRSYSMGYRNDKVKEVLYKPYKGYKDDDY